MNEPNLLVMCLNAFLAVLVLLSLLALAMRLLIAVFPPACRPAAAAPGAAPARGGDHALAAAIAAAVQAAVPGGRVTRIEATPKRENEKD